MSDDAVEEMLDKVVRLLAYISDKVRAPITVVGLFAALLLWFAYTQWHAVLHGCLFYCPFSHDSKGTHQAKSSKLQELSILRAARANTVVFLQDLFAEFYRKRLSRRLLHDKSASEDHEKAVLGRLKQQCGAQFTSKVWSSC